VERESLPAEWYRSRLVIEWAELMWKGSMRTASNKELNSKWGKMRFERGLEGLNGVKREGRKASDQNTLSLQGVSIVEGTQCDRRIPGNSSARARELDFGT
jgi:hypothetical protein